VEAALVLPLVIVLVMGIIDFGFAFGSKTTASGASRSGVRLAAAAYATAGTASTNQKAAVDKIANTVTGSLTGLTSATVAAPASASATAGTAPSWSTCPGPGPTPTPVASRSTTSG